ncbi:metallophosphoesterase [Hyphomonas sp.]|uniref:metallophosphoesterase family protein n=1 Tax=Hyphomonas sp. TaxID=87 RepID=UPI0032EE5896
MRIVQLADLHFGAENPRAMDAAAAQIADLEPDVIVVSGDMTQRGKHDEFEAARNWIDALDRPTLIVPGNHDTPLLNLVSRASSPFQRHHGYFEDHSAPQCVGDIRIDGLNTARGWQVRSNWAEGSVRLAHLEDILDEDAGDDTIRMLACHHPFRSPSDAPLRTRTRRGAAASELLAASPVSVLLTGHVHTPHAELITEATGSYLAITAGTLSTRLRSAPAAFNSLDISDGALRVNTHDFDGTDFQPRRLGTWSANEPHRQF